MTTVIENIALISPDFSSLNNLQDYIDLAETLVSEKVCQRTLAVAFMTAHLIELANRGGSVSGAITSESEGALSRSYGTAGGFLLSSTPYGLEYLRLLRSCGLVFTMRTFL